MVQNALVRQMLAEMHEFRLQMAKFIKSSPVMGADYIDDYPFGGEEHPYKNLANIILWCEYWLNKIKQNDYLEKIKPNYNKEEKLKTYHELLATVEELYQKANNLKNKIIHDELADDGAGLINYMKEDELLKSLDPNMSFMRPKLELLQQILIKQEPIVERNKLIYEDFKHCLVDSDLGLNHYLDKKLKPLIAKYGQDTADKYFFIKSFLDLAALEEGLKQLINKYGQLSLDQYVEFSWISYSKNIIFEIDSLLDEVNTLTLKFKSPEIIIQIFFNEFHFHCELYKTIKNKLEQILFSSNTYYELKFYECIFFLYSQQNLKTKIEILYEGCDDRDYRSYEKKQYDKNENINKFYITWKIATQGLITPEQKPQLELSLSDKWLFYNYEFICETQNVLEPIVAGTLINRLINTIKCEYVNKMATYGLYKILLFFVGTNPINTDKDTNLYKIKQMALESLQYNIS